MKRPEPCRACSSGARLASCLAAAIVLTTLAGCSEPAPPVSFDPSYVGVWERGAFADTREADYRGRYVYLELTADGLVRYASYSKRAGATRCTAIGHSRLETFTESGFEVKFIWLFGTSFTVDRPPHEVEGEWRMTVDGNELVRREGARTFSFECEDGGLLRESAGSSDGPEADSV